MNRSAGEAVTPGGIVEFWLADAVDSAEQAMTRHATWYRCGPDFDAGIRTRFGPTVRRALDGELDHWMASAQGALALVLLLDQFTRNVFRGTARVYAGDGTAWRAADACVSRGDDMALPPIGRLFLYHPFHHSESLAQQDRAVALVTALRDTAPAGWHAYLQRSVEGFTRHRDIVARFGRFPHRNRVLGRADTPEEAGFLAAGADHFGQAPPASSENGA